MSTNIKNSTNLEPTLKGIETALSRADGLTTLASRIQPLSEIPSETILDCLSSAAEDIRTAANLLENIDCGPLHLSMLYAEAYLKLLSKGPIEDQDQDALLGLASNLVGDVHADYQLLPPSSLLKVA